MSVVDSYTYNPLSICNFYYFHRILREGYPCVNPVPPVNDKFWTTPVHDLEKSKIWTRPFRRPEAFGGTKYIYSLLKIFFI